LKVAQPTGGPWWNVLREALEAMEAEDGAERTRRLLSGEWEAVDGET